MTLASPEEILAFAASREQAEAARMVASRAAMRTNTPSAWAANAEQVTASEAAYDALYAACAEDGYLLEVALSTVRQQSQWARVYAETRRKLAATLEK